jgi:ABC-type uncharacterized transport system permease subunit
LTAFALLERWAGEAPWPAICVALSKCCVYDAVYRSFFAKLKLNIHLSGLLAFLIFSVLAKFVMKTLARITFAYEQAHLVQKKFPKMIN